MIQRAELLGPPGVKVKLSLSLLSLSPDLEVHLLNTEMDLQDLSFPQNSASDSSIQLSAATIKQYSHNGQQGEEPPPSFLFGCSLKQSACT